MRSAELLSALSIDLDYLDIQKIGVEVDGDILPIWKVEKEKDVLTVIGNVPGNLTVKEC
ncbi:hypothetical protein [Enterococcus sp. LJL51]|uniref:hypothetical protein n=1 Tax=Enterococcus sp. LJL51 TaxID=3416656 RepID=UPI003CE8F2F0